MMNSDYSYIDVAFDGVQNRNNLVKSTDLKNYAKQWRDKHKKDFTDCYTTYFKYPQNMIDHFKEKNTVSGYNGSCYADCLPIDVDSKDLALSLESAKAILLYLETTFDLDIKTIPIYFSGAKGFHIEMPSELFGFQPSPRLHEIFRHVVKRLLPEGLTVDESIYDKVRLWRIKNTINSKSGLYKTPLSVDELLNLTIPEIQDLARQPRKGVFFDDNITLNSKLDQVYLQVKSEVESRSLRTQEEKKYKNIFNDRVKEGERNTTLTSYAGKLKSYNMHVEEVKYILTSINQTHCTPPLDNREVESIVRSVYQYNNVKEIKLIRLSETNEPKKRDWMLEGIIPKNYPSNVYGDGGLGKSFLGLFLATQATRGGQTFLGRKFPEGSLTCLYLDWELEQEEISRRAYQIAKGLELSKPPEGLLYHSPTTSLLKFLKELPKLIESEGIQLLIIDSLGAAGVDPDNVIVIVEVMTALKNLGVTPLTFDHQSKMQKHDNYDSKTPFGSVYKFNLARSVFQLSKLNDSKNPLCLQLKHKKSNFSSLSDDLMFEVHFQGDRVLFTESRQVSKHDEDTMTVHEAMLGLKEKGTETIQQNIVSALKGVLGKDKIRDLLDKGMGRYWNIRQREGRGGGKIYEPKEVFLFSDYIYVPKTSKLPSDPNDSEKQGDDSSFSKSSKSGKRNEQVENEKEPDYLRG